MRLDDEQESVNFEDRTGQRGGGGFGFGGGGGLGGGGLGLILSLVASRFGIGGVLILALGYCALTSLGGSGGGIVGAPSQVQSGASAAETTIDPTTKALVLRVLGSTERRWTDLFAASGAQYKPTKLVAYSGSNQSACGAAQSAMGPFYCPADESIYLDTAFFDELRSRFGAPGDFAQAYVIAHEVGHHVQKLTGVADQVRAIQQRSGEAEGNRAQVAMELQADCYAGVWAANDKNLLEADDVEEGLGAAQAIGDDTLQRSAGQRPVPESFTHGTSAQRMQWLRTGLNTGDPTKCDTFGGRLS